MFDVFSILKEIQTCLQAYPSKHAPSYAQSLSLALPESEIEAKRKSAYVLSLLQMFPNIASTENSCIHQQHFGPLCRKHGRLIFAHSLSVLIAISEVSLGFCVPLQGGSSIPTDCFHGVPVCSTTHVVLFT